jgi:hypothetical protein
MGSVKVEKFFKLSQKRKKGEKKPNGNAPKTVIEFSKN